MPVSRKGRESIGVQLSVNLDDQGQTTRRLQPDSLLNSTYKYLIT